MASNHLLASSSQQQTEQDDFPPADVEAAGIKRHTRVSLVIQQLQHLKTWTRFRMLQIQLKLLLMLMR
jgi:hypothetical protein